MNRKILVYLFLLPFVFLVSSTFFVNNNAFSANQECNNISTADSYAGRSQPEFSNGGRVSTFGGPNDTGVSYKEGLALISNTDKAPSGLFLPSSGTGLARQLNPDSYYVAARWPYSNSFRTNRLPNGQLDSISSYSGGFPVVIEANGKKITAWAVDYGPNGNTTNKDIDLSPGAAKALGLQTGDKISSLKYATNASGKDTPLGSCTDNITQQCSSKPTEAVKAECEKQVCADKPTETAKAECKKQACEASATTPAEKAKCEVKKPEPPKPTNPTNKSIGKSSDWQTSPYCYKYEGDPGKKGLYENIQTCNGGYYCYADNDGCHCTEKSDCGKNNKDCNSSAPVCWTDDPYSSPKAGCLNYACKKGKNAIWDKQSKKCGCDDGHWETSISEKITNTIKAITDALNKAKDLLNPNKDKTTTEDKNKTTDQKQTDDTKKTTDPKTDETQNQTISSGPMAEKDAKSALDNAGINYSDRTSKSGLNGVRGEVVNDLVATKNECPSCDININSARDGVHNAGTYSHLNGYKADLKTNTILDNHIKNSGNFEKLNFTRSDKYGASNLYRHKKTGAIYAYEKNSGTGYHWDVASRSSYVDSILGR